MASVFTRIIKGELPGRFVYRDERSVAILSINPIKPGHTLVIPIEEIDYWNDLSADLLSHLFAVSQKISRAMQQAFQPRKVGVMVAGLEVPHVHIHLVPIHDVHDLDFAKQEKNPDPAKLDEAAERIRAALQSL